MNTKKLNCSRGKTYEEICGKEKAKKWKEKLSFIRIGNRHPMFGKHLGEETKEKIRLGNVGKVLSEETRQKISLKTKGKPSLMKGKKRSEEFKEKQRLSHVGKSSIKKGKTYEELFGIERSKEIRGKQSLANKCRKEKLGYLVSPEARKRLSLTLTGHLPNYPKPYFVSELSHRVRSSYEEKTGLFLKQNNILYAYEKPFLLIYPDGSKHFYYVDFVLLNEKVAIETKGFFKSQKDKLKLKLFKEQYPQYKLILVGSKEYLEKEAKEFCDKIINIESLNDVRMEDFSK